MKGYDNTGPCGRLGGCKVVGPGRSDYIYWSEIRAKCVLAGLYGAVCDWFSLARGRRQTQPPVALKGEDEERDGGWGGRLWCKK